MLGTGRSAINKLSGATVLILCYTHSGLNFILVTICLSCFIFTQYRNRFLRFLKMTASVCVSAAAGTGVNCVVLATNADICTSTGTLGCLCPAS